jgi:hypothetical protein
MNLNLSDLSLVSYSVEKMLHLEMDQCKNCLLMKCLRIGFHLVPALLVLCKLGLAFILLGFSESTFSPFV